MAFVKINKSARGIASHTHDPEIRIGYHLGNEKNKNRTLYIAMTRKLIDQLGWPLTEGSSRLVTTFSIQEGTQEDAGFFLLGYDENGYAIGTTTGKRPLEGANYSLTANLSVIKLQHYAINDPTEEKNVISADYSIIDGNQLLVEVPDWLRYFGPPAEPKPEPVKEVAKEREPRPTPLRKIAREVVDETAADIADVMPLNRAQRRKLAADVARKIAH